MSLTCVNLPAEAAGTSPSGLCGVTGRHEIYDVARIAALIRIKVRVLVMRYFGVKAQLEPIACRYPNWRRKSCSQFPYRSRSRAWTLRRPWRQRHGHKGKLYNIRIDLGVVGGEIAVTHQGPLDHAHEDVYVAIRDGFNAAVRQLEDYERKQRGKVKAHEVPLHGVIAGMSHDHGFIDTSDGRHIYFHRNSVAQGDFDELEAGDEVRLVIHPGEGKKGPQASTVVPIGKHHLVER
jgi:cold shock CspA family protein